MMYKTIRSHPTTLEIYAKKLIAEGVVTQGEVDKMRADWRQRLEAEFEAGQSYPAEQGRLARRPLGGLKASREMPTTIAAARPASISIGCKQIGERAHRGARRLQRS